MTLFVLRRLAQTLLVLFVTSALVFGGIESQRTGQAIDLADYIAAPTKKRDDYPEMPPQNYLDPETRLEVAKYMLSRTN